MTILIIIFISIIILLSHKENDDNYSKNNSTMNQELIKQNMKNQLETQNQILFHASQQQIAEQQQLLKQQEASQQEQISQQQRIFEQQMNQNFHNQTVQNHIHHNMFH